MDNAVLACIKTRRSIRRYTREAVSPEQVNALLEAAAWAPSGSNNQSWLFTAIGNKAVLAELNETVRRIFLTWTPDDDYPAKRGAAKRAASGDYCFFHNAPLLIIASNKPGYQNAMADCSAALQNIFLAAHSLGLGSCWVNQLRWLRDEKPLRQFLATLGLPEEHEICCAAALGHPEQTPPAPERKPGTTIFIE